MPPAQTAFNECLWRLQRKPLQKLVYRHLTIRLRRDAHVGGPFAGSADNREPAAPAVSSACGKNTTAPTAETARFTPQQEAESPAAQTSTRIDLGSLRKYCLVPFWEKSTGSTPPSPDEPHRCPAAASLDQNFIPNEVQPDNLRSLHRLVEVATHCFLHPLRAVLRRNPPGCECHNPEGRPCSRRPPHPRALQM